MLFISIHTSSDLCFLFADLFSGLLLFPLDRRTGYREDCPLSSKESSVRSISEIDNKESTDSSIVVRLDTYV